MNFNYYYSNILLTLKNRMKTQKSLLSISPPRNSFFKRVLINFSLCYLFFNLNNKFIRSSSEVKCAKEKFWIFGKSSEGLELNNLEKRVAAVQHNANNPIEDRYAAVELQNFPGYFISVLDGHGGFQCAEYANQRLMKYFDNMYKDLKEANPNLTEYELVVNSLLKTFAIVEKEFYDISIDLYRKGEGKMATVGSCVLISIISKDKIYTAQLGDSKAKLYRKNKNGELERVKLTVTHNAEKKHQQELLRNEFKDKDIVVCKRPNNTVCYVKGRLQPTRVRIYIVLIYYSPSEIST
jgi:hypothetical protein